MYDWNLRYGENQQHEMRSGYKFATEELAILVKQYARLGIWLLTTIDQLDEAIKLGAEIIETNGQLKPDAKERR